MDGEMVNLISLDVKAVFTNCNSPSYYFFLLAFLII